MSANTGTPSDKTRARELAAAFAEQGDPTGWFDALYREARGDNTLIPWADLEPNRYLQTWVAENGLEGRGLSALVIGCGLGDDAKYLTDLGFKVTAFDLSSTAIEWARELHAETDIDFYIADLLHPPGEWRSAFDFVLEVYTIQPLPVEMRTYAMRHIARFVAPGGRLLVVTRGRADDEKLADLPWPVSRTELGTFFDEGLTEVGFTVIAAEDGEAPRFVVEYLRQ